MRGNLMVFGLVRDSARGTAPACPGRSWCSDRYQRDTSSVYCRCCCSTLGFPVGHFSGTGFSVARQAGFSGCDGSLRLVRHQSDRHLIGFAWNRAVVKVCQVQFWRDRIFIHFPHHPSERGVIARCEVGPGSEATVPYA